MTIKRLLFRSAVHSLEQLCLLHGVNSCAMSIFCFFDFNYIQDKKPDFKPVRYGNDKNNYMDTEGGPVSIIF